MIFKYMGLFDSDKLWIHPERTEPTYELIYNLKNDIYLEENGIFHTVKKGEVIILKKGIMHRGWQHTEGPVSFYWLHFLPPADTKLTYFSRSFKASHLFRELMHYSLVSGAEQNLKDAVLMHILALLSYENSQDDYPRAAREAFAYIRANASMELTAAKVAEHFGYTGEHLSRLVKKSYGFSLKTLIDYAIINSAKNLLSNTNLSVKEIAAALKFVNSNAFVRFYKYHEKISPSAFRKQFTYVYINSK